MKFRFITARLIRRSLLLAALAGTLALVACTGPAGSIYGEYWYDYSVYSGSANGYTFGIGGFPSGTLYTYQYYSVQPGTYNVYYTLEDGSGYFYPAALAYTYCATTTYDSTCASYYYSSSYTVTANKGQPFFQPGADKNFQLYLAYDGLYAYGANAAKTARTTVSPKAAAPNLGTTSYSLGNGLTVTVTNTIKKLQPGQKLPISNTVGVTKN